MALGPSVDFDEEKFMIWRGRVIQVLLSICGLFLCTSHGLMIGWPCHYFASTFRDPDPPIDIPFESAPLLAGNLMMGDISGTIISYFSRPNAKYAMVVGGATMAIGWGVLWQCQNIDWFFVSRQFIGIGIGVTTFNLKAYIEDLCDPKVSTILIKCSTVFTYFGVFLSTIIAYLGADIPTFGLCAGITTLTTVAICVVIPQTPAELFKFGDVKQARWLRALLTPMRTVEEDLAILDKKQSDYKECNTQWTDVFSKSDLRWKFLVLFLSCFMQQFTGMPATIVFGEFIYEKFKVPNPDIVTIFYMIILIVVYGFSTFLITKHKKHLMMLSSALVCLDLIILIIMHHFNVTSNYPVLVIVCMYLYIVFHTFGLGCLTVPACIEMFPPCYRKIVTHSLVMFNSMFAIIVGKTFQVLYSHFQLYGPFILYIIISGVSVLFIKLFIHKYEKSVITENRNANDVVGNSVS